MKNEMSWVTEAAALLSASGIYTQSLTLYGDGVVGFSLPTPPLYDLLRRLGPEDIKEVNFTYHKHRGLADLRIDFAGALAGARLNAEYVPEMCEGPAWDLLEAMRPGVREWAEGTAERQDSVWFGMRNPQAGDDCGPPAGPGGGAVAEAPPDHTPEAPYAKLGLAEQCHDSIYVAFPPCDTAGDVSPDVADAMNTLLQSLSGSAEAGSAESGKPPGANTVGGGEVLALGVAEHAVVGDWGVAFAGRCGSATAGRHGIVFVDGSGRARVGDFGLAMAEAVTTVSAGYAGTLVACWYAPDSGRRRVAVGYIGETLDSSGNPLEPDVEYRVSDRGAFVRQP